MKKHLRLLSIVAIAFFGVSCSTLAGEDVNTDPAESAGSVDSPAASPVPQSTATPEPPTAVPTPEAILASQGVITIGEYEFSVLQVAFDSTVFGMAPTSLGSGDQILFIEFEIPTEAHAEFAALEPVVISGSGGQSSPVAWISAESMHTLADMKIVGGSSSFTDVGQNSLVLAYVVPGGADALSLQFPSGERIDLSPLMP
ncbi:MAG: hypothetical protein EPO32_09890 [Anaerolineae bacterium]|nr:MAG: hypothetical protein EPO32_09890 [Anaerolineae bacterium]